MTHPPTRADQIRMMGAGRGADVGGPKLTAIDLEDSNVRPDAWFVYVMPVQMGVAMIGAGRYGYWDSRPDVKLEDDWIAISGTDDEPIFTAPRAAVISVHLAKGKHIQALPFPMPEVKEDK
jgi:hypothetical protein